MPRSLLLQIFDVNLEVDPHPQNFSLFRKCSLLFRSAAYTQVQFKLELLYTYI